MPKKVKLELYNPNHYAALERLLKMFQKDVYKINTKINMQEFIDYHYGYIYMVMNDENIAVGFTSFVYNSYYGLREATLGNDYMYIEKEYRRTRAIHLICIQAGTLCQNNDIPLENYYASDDSSRFIGRMNGNKIFSTYIFPVEEVSRETERLKTKVRIKE